MLNISLKDLPNFAQTRRFILAYSGGLDSHVLLYAISGMREDIAGKELIAAHINHGLSEKADQWSNHCIDECKKLDIPLKNINVDASPKVGESPEAAARHARYCAFADFMQEGDCLLTAHHQDDQAETLLIQLLRGAGPRGLAAMPLVSDFEPGWHARPLLDVTRKELEGYAKDHNLSWVDDESNFDTGYDRNFLRHEILPILKQRFPAAASTLSRTAMLCAESAELLSVNARNDYQTTGNGENKFSANALFDLGEIRARNMLQQWFRDNNFPTPTEAQMKHIWEDVVCTEDESCPRVAWSGVEVRRYRDVIHVFMSMQPHDPNKVLQWNLEEPLVVNGVGLLTCVSRRTKENVNLLSEKLLAGRVVEARFRQGGEEIKPVGRNGHHSLKKLFQEQGIVPWERDRLPLIYIDDELIAVANLWIADGYASKTGDLGYRIDWVPEKYSGH